MRGLADEAWFVDVDVDTAMARVAARQVSHKTSVTRLWNRAILSSVSQGIA